MKKIFVLSFIVLGISSVIGQVIIIRELMISFYGNEFFIGWVLFAWLFWVGIGSLMLGKIFTPHRCIGAGFIGCHLLVAVFLPLEIYLARLGQSLIGGMPGEIPDIIPSLLYVFLIIAPLCLILGLQFAIATRFWSSLASKIGISHLIGKSYFYETIGFIIGGLVFSYILIFVNEFRIFSILALFNLIAAGGILILTRNRSLALKLIFLILIVCFSGIFVFSKSINNQTGQLRFPNQKLIESSNSLYGNIAVTKTKEQYNFYESGLLLGPDKEEIFNEYLIHFPLLYHHNPQNILLIGTGFNGALAEILKYQPNKIYYLELDAQLLTIAKKYISSTLSQVLEDKRIKIFTVDSRYFLKINQETFDVIIINLPDPSTALINRFYSQEFFQKIQSRLKPDGILSTHLSSSPNYLSRELGNLNISLYKTLQKVFPFLIILPEDTNFFIASSQNILDYNPQLLIQRLKERNIKTNFVTEPYIEYRLINDRVQMVLDSLKTNKEIKINQDHRPISYYYNLIYWLSYFRSGLAKFLTLLSKIKFSWVVSLFVLLIILSIVLRKRVPSRSLLPLAMAIAGFSLMATEIIIIYAFQVFYGYLYYKIGLIITALMVGMAIGTWLALHQRNLGAELGTKKIPNAKIKSLAIIHGLIIVFCLIFLLGSWVLFFVSPKPSLIIEVIFLVSAALIGAIVGFEFPIVNKLYLSQTLLRQPASPELQRGEGYGGQVKKVGTIYGADLLGSCLGASLISIFALPIFGIFQTLLILIMLNILILSTFFRHQKT